MKTKWSEIRIEYMDEEDGFWRVDAWQTDDDSEEGKVIALIDDLTGRVIYLEPLARMDEMAQEVIAEKVRQLDDGITIKKTGAGHIGIEVKTKAGVLWADVETAEYMGAEFDAIYTGIKLGKHESVVDLTATKVDENTVSLYEWSNPYDEDWKTKTEIAVSIILDAVKDE